MTSRSRFTSFGLGSLVLALVALATGPTAIGATAGHGFACSPSAGTQVFAGWSDSRSYVLAPGGDFESSAGWSFAGGAGTAAGNESYFVHGGADGHSASLPAGASVTTPPICIDPTQPTFRFFVSTLDGSGAQVSVKLLTTDRWGHVRSIELGVQPAAGSWQLSHSFGLAQQLRSPSVQLQFTAVGGAVLVDDVYVDPYIRA